MAVYGNNGQQTINPGESVIFTVTIVPPQSNNVQHRNGTGNVLLSGSGNRKSRNCCMRKIASYDVDFGANISIPTGQTVGEISVALAIDGATIPGTIMRSTPGAVEEFNAVSKSMTVPVWIGCCQTVTVRNTSNIPITMDSPLLKVSDYPVN